MRSILILWFSFFIVPGIASAAEYEIAGEKENLVKFISKAPIEEFEGVTDSATGTVKWSGVDSLEKGEFSFRIDLRTLDTGIGLRNQHMRDNYLETDTYPYAIYTGKVLEAEQRGEEGNYEVVAEGVFELHGVENTMTVSGVVEGTEDLYRISCAAELKLSDYNIKVPKLLVMKINEIIKLELDFYIQKVRQ